MSSTKRELVEGAFSYMGLAGYVFNLTPAQLLKAGESLERMMAFWDSQGIRIGYPLASSPSAMDLDDDAGVPDSSEEAISANLALRLAPQFGKTLSQEARKIAYEGYGTLLARAVIPHEVSHSSLPRGQGNKGVDQTFFSQTPEVLNANTDGKLDLN